MRDARFEILARSLTATGSRRRALAAVLGGAYSSMLGLTTGDDAIAAKSGKCTTECGDCEQCQRGRCSKKHGKTRCKSGTCVPKTNGTACGLGRVCERGRCQCTANTTEYGGQCRDQNSDLNNRGTCGTSGTNCELNPAFDYRVVAKYPHDREAFTQGLAFVDGVLYEGTGLSGASSIRRVDLESGAVLQMTALREEYFGEGIAVLNDRIYQLTWQNGLCLVFDQETFEVLANFQYVTEGWGLTSDGERLIMSNGTNSLFVRDPETFQVLETITVSYGNRSVSQLNELEMVNGEVWANIWQTDLIARIDRGTGQVVSWVDLRGLLTAEDRQGHSVDVLNGIAYDPKSDRLFVTGKLWPTLFEIEVVPRP